MVIYDESTYIKNKDSNRWTICNALFHDVKRRVILTGTPSPNGLHDLWGQIFHLDHGQSLGTSLSDFRRMYFLRDGYRYLPLKNAKKEISKKIAHLVMPMKSKDYLQLPAFNTNTIKCLLEDDLEPKYAELERDFFLDIAGVEVSAFDAAALSIKLRQFVQGFLYTDDGGTTILHDLKLQALKDIIEGTNDNVLVAVQFKQDIKAIKDLFGHSVPCIHGDSDPKEDIINIGRWNRKELKMLVMHPASGGHGLNLQKGGATIVWFGVTWNLEHYDQLNARLHRQGQTRPVISHHIIMKGTIDEVGLSTLKRKSRTQSDLFADVLQYRKAQLGG